jgi:hypothetical protein
MAQLLKMLVSEGIGFLVEPARERRVVVHEIEIALTRWKNIYANPADAPTPPRDGEREKAGDNLRTLASRLIVATDVLHRRRLGRIISRISKSDASEVSGLLIGISNSLYHPFGTRNERLGTQNVDDAERIRHLLGLDGT